MREKPIIFSTEMVRAILDGNKTTTRRIIDEDFSNQFDVDVDGSVCAYICPETGDHYKPEETAPWQLGDKLWVRETWRCVKYDNMDGDLNYGVEFKDGTRKYFKFDDSERYHQFGKYALKKGWRPSIHMPKDAARIWLEVTGVRVERLQEINNADRLKEGIRVTAATAEELMNDYKTAEMGRQKFIKLWNSTIKKQDLLKYGWEINPWVWVCKFEREDGLNHEEA